MLKKLQAGTGLLIAGFLVLHLVNLWLAPFGAAAYDGAQSSVRGIYQWPPLEIALLAAISIHLVIGILGLKRAPKSPMTARRRLHRYSGIFLGLSIGGHILAVRGTRYVVCIRCLGRFFRRRFHFAMDAIRLLSLLLLARRWRPLSWLEWGACRGQ